MNLCWEATGGAPESCVRGPLTAPDVTPYKHLGKISDILLLNNKNNQLERRVQPPRDISLNAQSWT